MTKVEAIQEVLKDNGGVAVWNILYNQLEKHYPKIKSSKEWKAGVRGVLYRELGKKFKMIDVGLIALIDYDETKLLLDDDIDRGDTSKIIQSKIRIGQEKFRLMLIKQLRKCPITGIDEKRILNASHIKPWALSTNFERLDINNGFIFSPTIDKLFDTGLITFENNKELIISSSLSEKNINYIGIEKGKKYLKLPTEDRLKYLDYHRQNIFIE
ncbi:HNH endonuclease [Flavobacterium salilacus subsp. salilacus]|uniref:HNH endonuclease n=1 Tax=Flavobacterium TaxID=237 RepID=UPI001074FEDD|nr:MULTISPECIES: HNH endonuclease signature motif containing protein [Flavobacterium]KAF2518995.1 HNH endonuclease [Flavobacterium salilacus subsp. salilacus]MBE1614842.1 HNH endonuclease [Flavobacterium sp. SaA2.13]